MDLKLYNKLDNLRRKGILFYLNLQKKKVQRRNKFFGVLFKTFHDWYTLDNLKFDVGKDLFPTGLYSRFFFNIYEQEEVLLVKEYIDGDNKVLELGACIGVVSCLTNKQLKKPENHVVVEANPNLIQFLEKNKGKNRCKFNIINGAISDKKKIKFYTNDDALDSSLFVDKNKEGVVKEHHIKGYTPDRIEGKYGFKFDTLIMDIEGGEFEIIEKYTGWLYGLKLLIIEFHPRRLKQKNDLADYFSILEKDCNFKLIDSLGQSYVFSKNV